jgi:dCTP deaminase
MGGFWRAETMRQRIGAEGLVAPYVAERVVNGAYELSLGSQVYVTSAEADTKRELEPGEQVAIPPGQFANLLTEEKVTVPADSLGLISVRFRLKQRGLVNVSGFHVDPGYSGHLLFSVFNAGPRPVVIARGEQAFLLWFASFDAPTGLDDLYNGAPRDSITSDDVMQLQGAIATPQALADRVEELERWRSRAAKWSTVVAVAIVTGIIGLLFLPLRDALGDDKGTNITTTTVVTSTTATTGTSVTQPPATSTTAP